MLNAIVFSTSNATDSINAQLAHWVAKELAAQSVRELKIDDYELPIYSPQREQTMGSPTLVNDFINQLQSADVIIFGYAEYNGNFTSAWKNLSDWLSRTNRAFLQNKPVIALATSPGQGGGSAVLELAKQQIKFAGGNLLAALSLPAFSANFDVNQQQLIANANTENFAEEISKLQRFFASNPNTEKQIA